jgi:hypothetical protein
MKKSKVKIVNLDDYRDKKRQLSVNREELLKLITKAIISK